MQTLNIKGNIAGGLTAAIVALPLALAFGVQSGLGAEAGLYGAIVLGFFAALFGGTPSHISGPTGPITVITASLVMQSVHQFGTLEQAMPYILFVFFLAGLMQVGLGLIKVGDFINYIPYPVISGFMTGIGVILILLQLYPAIGHHPPTRVMDMASNYKTVLSTANLTALAITFMSIAIIYLTPRITKKIPGSLVAILISTTIVAYYHLDIPLIAHIPDTLPYFHFEVFNAFSFSNFIEAFVPALTLAAVASIETLLSSVVMDNLTKTVHKSNKELIGQGIGNALAACFTGIPGAGAAIRSTANINSGGTNKISGMVHSLGLLAILIFISEYASMIPIATLAGILITVGFSVIDYRGLRHIRFIPRSEALIIFIVAFLTVFDNLLDAVSVGIILACITFMKAMSDIIEERSHIAPIHEFQEEQPWEDEANIPEHLHKHVYIKHLHGPLFFGFTSNFHGLTKKLPDIKAVIIRMKQVPYIDQSGLYALEDAYEYLASRKIKMILTGLNQQPKTMLESVEIIPNQIPQEHCFETFQQAVQVLDKELESQ